MEPVLNTAEKQDKSHLSFLDELLEEEVAAKEQRRIETALKISGLPFIKSIDEFDFTFQPRLDKQKVVSLALKACQFGMSIYFTNMEELIKKLRKDQEAGRSGKGRSYYKSSLVVVDEVGYTPISREECNLFFRFVANRYEKASTIVTSNKAFSDWTELFHDPIIVTAVLDRLLHHSVVINIKGNSYRLKGKLKEKTLNGIQKVN